MIVYQATKSQFLRQIQTTDIGEHLQDEFQKRLGRRVGVSELTSWRLSLQSMARVLLDDEIPADTGIAIEYNIPQTGKRVDFILTGRGPDGSPNVVIVELKQWESAQLTEKDGVVLTQLGRALQETSHPSYQAWSYAALLEGFNEAVHEGGLTLQPCAYLHNYKPDDVIQHDWYAPYIEKAPVFLKGDVEKQKLREFIKRHVKYGDDVDLLYKIENGRIRPSKMLADSLLRMLIAEKNKVNNKSRVVAGYCWKWPSKKDPEAFDIVIPEHDYRKRWNLDKDSSLWIVAPDSINEVGCIHTCQGLEVDYIGVIVGDDFVVRNGEVICRPEKRAASDKSIFGWKQLLKDKPAEGKRQLDLIVKNTYSSPLVQCSLSLSESCCERARPLRSETRDSWELRSALSECPPPQERP